MPAATRLDRKTPTFVAGSATSLVAFMIDRPREARPFKDNRLESINMILSSSPRGISTDS